MVEREAPLAEVITALGTQAQQVKTLEERRALIDVATTLAQTSEGRFLIDSDPGLKLRSMAPIQCCLHPGVDPGNDRLRQ
jgi:hypothetical protein